MRFAVVLLAGFGWVAPALSQEAKDNPPKRYGIEANLDSYPQDHPKTALLSVIKTIEAGRIDYLLAQLSDPKFVDARVRLHDGKFEELVKETTAHLADDPTLLKDLKRIAKDGEWEAGDSTASAAAKDNKDKRVFLRKIGNRWFLENRQK
jgi:hypothetical protein